MVKLPTLVKVNGIVATPPSKEPVPRVVLPSSSVTVPVAALGETFAVKTTS